MGEPVRPSSMLRHPARTTLVFGFGLSLVLACQSGTLSVPTQPTVPASGSAGAGAASGSGAGTGGGVADGTPCPTAQTRCGAACVDEATDSQNCGGCGLACDNCTNGRCIRILASGQPGPRGLAVTSSEVVWANTGETADGEQQDASILKIPIGGGVPAALATLAQSDSPSQSLAVDSGYVYWGKSDSATGNDGAIMKTPLAGGATMTVASTSYPQFIAVSGGVVYWVAQTGIMSAPTSGGPPVAFAPGRALTLAAGKAYWFDEEGNNLAIRTRELAPGAGEANLTAWNMAEGPQVVCLPDMDSLHVGRTWLAVSPTDLYWTVSLDGGGCLGKVPLAGGTPSAIDWDLDVNALAVDADSVYWFDQSTSPSPGTQILKAPLAGGTPIRLATTAGGVGSLVVDDTSVYFVDTFGGNVVQVTPK
jgi:hypothetical protein